jgi:hypothetical protein
VSETKSIELRVSVDVGYRRLSVPLALPKGEVLVKIEITGLKGLKSFSFFPFWKVD